MKFKIGDVLEPKNPLTRRVRMGIVLRITEIGEQNGEMCYRMRWSELNAPAKTMLRWSACSFVDSYYQVAYNGVQIMVGMV